MAKIGRNLKIIRTLEGLNQAQFGYKFGMSRPTYAQYENDLKEPDDALLYKMSKALNKSVEELTGLKMVRNGTREKESSLREVNPYVIHVPLVGQYAHAGYLSGYSDEEYMGTLPKVTFNIERDPNGNYVAFEVTGDSMDDGTKESYEAGYLLLCRELDRKHWRDRLHFKQYDFVLVHRTEGILLKRIIAHNIETSEITVHSLNPLYQDDTFSLNDIAQLFNVVRSERSRKRG